MNETKTKWEKMGWYFSPKEIIPITVILFF